MQRTLVSSKSLFAGGEGVPFAHLHQWSRLLNVGERQQRQVCIASLESAYNGVEAP